MPLEHVLAAVMVGGLVLYLLGGGADFGGGVWDLLASGPRKGAQRALIEKAIGPIWEANHVWFIFVFVLLFSAFPPAFATLTTALFTPLTLYALGLVMRGAAFTFRHYDADVRRRRRFGAMFSAASVGCPFLLGAMGAALVREQPLSLAIDVFVVAAGLFTLALVAALAATYLTVEAADEALREDFRRRALGSLAVAGLASWVALGTAGSVAPHLIARVGQGGPAVFGTLFGALALALVATRRFRLARLVVGALAGTVVIGWALAKGETLVWGEHTLGSSHAQPSTMVFLLAATVIAAVLVGPSLVFLFTVFARPARRA
ncbi:MAG: cytochrome d ubiquinol oxidase subunit II [Myxococcaceae bacterium]|jgi:cytochrome d ubiquinol oxidase subunit II|nr:cytochrome d ubiquinol oxidase subunit II [Myxococcaceae bacterium]